jgi:DNA-binding NarL/FixJ family response regulator
MNNHSLKLVYTDNSASGRFLAGFFLKKFSFLISRSFEAETPGEMVQVALDTNADAVLINYKGVPLSVIQQLRTAAKGIRIVVMNFDNSEFEKLQLVKAGVNAILPVETTLQNILLGLSEIRPEQFMSNYLMPEIRLRKMNEDGISRLSDFSMTEVECIKAICDGLKPEQIAERISVPENQMDHLMLELHDKTRCSTTLDFIRFAFLNKILNAEDFLNNGNDRPMSALGS